jgi:cell wall-associated NlpC family hydrolase
MTWLSTPYHHMGRVKGAGTDCLCLLADVFEEAGLIPRVGIPFYPKDWMHHRDAERYLEGLLRYAGEIDGPPLPGDIVLWKFGRCFSHGAIVVEWPTVVHACAGRNVSLDDAGAAAWLTHIGENTEDSGKPRPKRFFSFWGK